MDQLLNRITGGKAERSDVDLLREVAEQIGGKCLCPLGDFSTSAVVSGLELFEADYEHHVQSNHPIMIDSET